MSQQFTGVQILRLVAAMLVVVMHTTQAISMHNPESGTGQYWEKGSAGVDIFFVISGFVMAMSVSSLAGDGPSRLSAAWVFLKRRLLRIVPLYWFYTLLKAALLLALPGLAMRASIEPGHLVASLLFIPAMSPWHLINPTLPVGWTLNFEMLFYTVFAISIVLGAPRIRFCLGVFLLICLAGRFFPTSVPLTFYGQSIVFEFILGVCIAHVFLSFRKMAPLVGLFAVLGGMFFMFGIDWGPSSDRLVTWGCGAALAVLGAVWLEPWTVRAPLTSWLSFLGDASYSIYLSHTFVVPAGVLTLKQLGVQNTLFIVPAISLVVIISACFSYIWLERPMTLFLKSALFRTSKLTHLNAGNTHAK
jgi:exopolysaccharide production protein ExoZ